MTGTDPGAGGADAERAHPLPDESSVDGRAAPWLLRQKIAIPDRMAGYFDRAGLVDRAMPTRRRLTVLVAPGGFGKTTLLGECCRRAREDGIPVAWVSVDEQDEPAVLDTYVACACRSAAGGAPAEVEDLGSSVLGSAGGEAGGRTGLALREIEACAGPFVLVFDELERLASPDAAALLEFLLRHGPPNLHLAFSGRELPAGVNVTGAVLDGQAEVLSADDLRFTSAEIADFFDGKLSGRRLDAVMSESAGWPFALRLSRNELERGARDDARASRKLVENWVESRLFAGLGAEDREFLLDIGLFEWMDAALLDEVLERGDSMHWIDTMPALAGLLEPVRDGATELWRLHPLIREHCARQRFRETPERFRAIHRRIAVALGRRRQTVDAMRHAVKAGEPALAGDIVEDAGGVRLYHREGAVQLQAAHRLLTEDAVASRPRLALVRCMSSLLSGRMDEARAGYCALDGALDSLEVDASGAALELAADHCMVRGVILLYGNESMGSTMVRTHLADVARLADSPHLDILTRGIFEYSLCVAGNLMGNIGEALGHAARARQFLAESRYLSMFMDVQEGQAAMAQGRVQDAAALYRRAERVAAERYVLDPEPAAVCSALMHELSLECGSAAPGAAPERVPEALTRGRTSFQAYAAASGAVLEARLRDEGVDAAHAGADEMLDYVRSARLPALVRYVSALRVSLLATAGRIGAAERAWESAELPPDAAGCLDLAGQTWREMEALSSARLRLAIGRGCFEEARSLAGELRTVAAERGLKRTLMRALALSAVLERRAGDGAAAAAHVEDYLRAYADSPYAGPLVRERAECAELLAHHLETAPGAPTADAARSLLAAMGRADEPRRRMLSAREQQVLQRLEGRRDKQIAAELGLSAHGVRFHLRNLFAKLGARNRAEALRRAREIGLIPGDS